MRKLKCFLLKPVGADALSLRRYCDVDVEKCPSKYGYHNAMKSIGTMPESTNTDEPPHSHPDWPIKCDYCGYVFKDSDRWQLFNEHLFIREDTKEVTTLAAASPGAMWLADWMPEGLGSVHFLALPESIRKLGQLIVKTPGGDWNVDSKSSNGDGWTRTGTAPNVTARPSIMVPYPGGYHGFLTNGELVEC